MGGEDASGGSHPAKNAREREYYRSCARRGFFETDSAHYQARTTEYAAQANGRLYSSYPRDLDAVRSTHCRVGGRSSGAPDDTRGT